MANNRATHLPQYFARDEASAAAICKDWQQTRSTSALSLNIHVLDPSDLNIPRHRAYEYHGAIQLRASSESCVIGDTFFAARCSISIGINGFSALIV